MENNIKETALKKEFITSTLKPRGQKAFDNLKHVIGDWYLTQEEINNLDLDTERYILDKVYLLCQTDLLQDKIDIMKQMIDDKDKVIENLRLTFIK